MADIIHITDKPVRVGSIGAQELRLAKEVLAYDELDLVLRVLSLEGTAGPNVTIELQTGMQLDSEEGWVQAAAFSNIDDTETPSEEKANVKNFLRYLRWNVTTLGGTDPFATFTIVGVGRRWA